MNSQPNSPESARSDAGFSADEVMEMDARGVSDFFATTGTADSGSYNVWLPAKFWNDHADRELPAGVLIKTRGNRVQVNCTHDELAEILNDAEYYSDPAGPDDYEGRAAMVRSAKATVRAIKAVLLSSVSESKR